MARLHAIVVVPATIVALASAAHGAAGARACQAVLLPVSCPSATTPAGENDRQAVAVELVAGLPHAGLAPATEAAAPGATRPAPAAAAVDMVTGGAVAASARGPPARPA
jgi:hypothetical protein